MTVFEDLVRLVPPPAEPVDAHGDWGVVEAALGLELPRDYKALFERYGCGQFLDHVELIAPFGTQVKEIEMLRCAEQLQGFDDCPYPLYPEPGGLLEWATTVDGDKLCWATEGDPDSWPVVIWQPSDDDSCETHDMGVAEYLHGWLSGRIDTWFIEWTDAPPWFEPYRNRIIVRIALSDGRLPHSERLRILREALAPTADRGGDYGASDPQQHFAATELGCRLAYTTDRNHEIIAVFPPEDEQRIRVALFDAVHRMGCQVLSAVHMGNHIWA